MLEATEGRLIGGTLVGNVFSSFHTDSREVAAGGVFFALRGAELDGHEFASDAIQRGAAAVIVERRVETEPGVAEILVSDTWAALYALAAATRDRVRPLVIAVTGSNGKTSTKEMVAAILARRFDVLRTSGNLNTETGVPLTMLRLAPEHSALVLEMGMQRAGDISRLVALAKPTVGIITNVGSVHMEFFASQEELARAKGELVAGLPEGGFAVLNADDPHYSLLAGMTAARVYGFGFTNCDYQAEGYRALPEGGSAFSLGGVEVRVSLQGRHQVLNAAAALGAAELAGVPVEVGAQALSEVIVEHRLQEVESPAGFLVVDDAYNASPESMLAAFDAMAERPPRGHLLAVLGPMGELGALSDEAHRRVGLRAAEVFDAVCVLDGEHARALAAAAAADVVQSHAKAVAWVRKNARAGDRVLVKGSHGLRLDKVVKELTT